MDEPLSPWWASVCSVANKVAKAISMVYVYRESPWTTLIPTWLMEVRTPDAFAQASIHTPKGDVQVTALASDGFSGHMASDPGVGLLATQPQSPAQF